MTEIAEVLYERITPDAFKDVEDRFDAWCDMRRVVHRPWGAAAEDKVTRELLGLEDVWQRNRADRIVRIGKRTQLLVDIKSTTRRNGQSGNVSIELRTLWAAEKEQPKWTIYAIWHEDDWWYLTPFEVVRDAIWACCDECWLAVQRHDFAALPTKCPSRSGRGSGDPHLVVSMQNAHPLDDLLLGRIL